MRIWVDPSFLGIFLLLGMSLLVCSASGQSRDSILTPRDSPHPESAVSHLHLKKKDMLMRNSRSIAHGAGSDRKCEHMDDLKKFLPDLDSPKEPHGGHYHLLLSVSDNQLAFLINWLAVAYEFGYLPNPRILVHYTCEGEATRNFVENHLLAKCIHPPERNDQGKNANETMWRQVIKDRLGTYLQMVLNLKTDENDLGALTFDVDAIWIRQMIDVFDHFANDYDMIAQGTMMDRNGTESYMDGKVLTNFGGVFIKNSEAGKALAKQSKKYLNDPTIDFDWPDQDYVSHAIFSKGQEGGKGTQKPLALLEHLSQDSSYHNEHCEEHHDTCTWLSSGVNGDFTISDVKGRYMFFPSIVAGKDCDVLCSGETTLFQHCGLANCIENAAPGQAANHGCHEIPEFILHSHRVTHLLNRAPPKPADFTPAPHGTFDSRHEHYQVEVVRKFVSPKRLLDLCHAYSAICKVGEGGKLIMSHQT